jgi:hypothetical protein
MQIGTPVSQAPVASTTYYFGGDGAGLNTAYANAKVLIHKASVLMGVFVKVRLSGAASGENVAHSIRVNDATDYSVGNLTYTLSNNELTNNAMAIPVNALDTLVLKVVTPAWSAAPTVVRWYISLFFAE